MKKAKDENLIADIEPQIKVMQAQIKKEKDKDLETYKEAIINEIEKEIVSRYYYQKGKIQVGLKNDKEIKEAIDVLRDKTKYEKLLNGK